MRALIAALVIHACEGCVRVVACAAAATSGRIVGGTEATPHSYPFIAALVDTNGDHFCGGSIVGRRSILTAAHCVEGETASTVRVVVGRHNLATGTEGQELE